MRGRAVDVSGAIAVLVIEVDVMLAVISVSDLTRI